MEARDGQIEVGGASSVEGRSVAVGEETAVLGRAGVEGEMREECRKSVVQEERWRKGEGRGVLEDCGGEGRWRREGEKGVLKECGGREVEKEGKSG